LDEDLGDLGDFDEDMGDLGDLDDDEDLFDSDEGGIEESDTNPTMVMSSEMTAELTGEGPGEMREFSAGRPDLEDEFLDEEDDFLAEDETELAGMDDELNEETEVIETAGVNGIEEMTETMVMGSESDLGGEETAIFDNDLEELEEDISDISSPAQGEMVINSPMSGEVAPFHEGEMIRLQAIIRQLREERDQMSAEIKEQKAEKKLLEHENLGLKAELDEVKIEVSIIKKRHADEIDEMKYRLRLYDEKKMIAEEKSKRLQKEFDRLQHKVRLNYGHVRQREKELESQLELVKMDSESQVQARDKKILDLKRKIDQLEFNMENAVIKEQKSRGDKVRLEKRLDKIMRTLRGSIEILEEDIDLEADPRIEQLK
jgi:outer membrane murein-binding lipoprotein Lpp